MSTCTDTRFRAWLLKSSEIQGRHAKEYYAKHHTFAGCDEAWACTDECRQLAASKPQTVR